MLKHSVLPVFILILIIATALGTPLVLTLSLGLVVFILIALSAGISPAKIWSLCLGGIHTTQGIIITFFLIGMLTALWRASGTIAVIVHATLQFITPHSAILASFLINCLVSLLTGSAFATAATAGVICAAMGHALGVDIFWTGGAILSGIYFGDRCSPISTSAQLVCALTTTDIFTNIRNMLRSAAIPFVFTAIVYLVTGFYSAGSASLDTTNSIFEMGYTMNPICAIPAIVIVVFAIFRVNVRTILIISIIASFLISVFIEKVSLFDTVRFLITGYETNVVQLSTIVNGGGIKSMLSVIAIILISSCFVGLLDELGLLESIECIAERISKKTSNYIATLIVAVVTSASACSQTLSIMLTHKICTYFNESRGERALNIEDTAVVVSALIPWSIACAVPLAAVDATISCIFAAIFLYALPGWRLLLSLQSRRRKK